MITWSIVAGAAGICGTGAVIARLASRWPRYNPERCWLIGMAALVPAWLIAFLGVLGLSPAQGPERPLFIFSSSLPLLGAIVTDAVVRRLRESGGDHRPVTYWLLGIAAFLPGWAIGVIGLMVKTTGK